MNRTQLIRRMVISTLLLALCGAGGACVSTGTARNAPRSSVRFASPAAAQTFYEAYIAKNYTRAMGAGSYVALGVPVQLPYEHKEYPTDNIYFNAAVAAADTDRDGTISQDEARGYGETIHALPEGVVAVAKQR